MGNDDGFIIGTQGTFFATKEWLEKQEKLGLDFYHREAWNPVQGQLQIEVDRQSYEESKVSGRRIDVRSRADDDEG